jgi:hypothetical protein
VQLLHRSQLTCCSVLEVAHAKGRDLIRVNVIGIEQDQGEG